MLGTSNEMCVINNNRPKILSLRVQRLTVRWYVMVKLCYDSIHDALNYTTVLYFSIRKNFIRPIWFENCILKMASGVEKHAAHYIISPPAPVHPTHLQYRSILGFVG